MVQDQKADWQRCCEGGENLPTNVLLFHVTNVASQMAAALGDAASHVRYEASSRSLRGAIHEVLWDDAVGAFRDNPTSSLHPQDGNSRALWFNLTTAATASRISAHLQGNWGRFGASSPEWDGNIGTFPGSMEVHGHLATGNAERGMALMRLQWGYMLGNPNSTQSTFWEGYNKDGTFNFQGIYMSNAHGWATGPAAALSTHVLGIRGMAPGGKRYMVSPSPGLLEHCQGSLQFTTNHKVSASWRFTHPTRRNGFELHLNTTLADPRAVGIVGLPLPSGEGSVEGRWRLHIDGTELWRVGQSRRGIRLDVDARRVWVNAEVVGSEGGTFSVYSDEIPAKLE